MFDAEIQYKFLGMKVEVFDQDGKNIEHTGEPGEMVCTRPHPSLPVKFWGDTPDGKKLRETYFSFYPGREYVFSSDGFTKCTYHYRCLETE